MKDVSNPDLMACDLKILEQFNLQYLLEIYLFAFEVWLQILAIRVGFPRNQVESICRYLIFTQVLLINTANAGRYRPIMSDMIDKICTQMKMKMKLL